jgi:hypothetical protein
VFGLFKPHLGDHFLEVTEVTVFDKFYVPAVAAAHVVMVVVRVLEVNEFKTKEVLSQIQLPHEPYLLELSETAEDTGDIAAVGAELLVELAGRKRLLALGELH